jgi:hypothetical protein
VDELVSEHVIGGLERAGKRQDNTALVSFRDAAGSLAQLPFDGVGLPELRAAGIKHQGLASSQFMREDSGQPGVPSFGHACGHPGRRFFLGVVIDIEVLRLEDLKLEDAILDLVLAEISDLSDGCRRREQ